MPKEKTEQRNAPPLNVNLQGNELCRANYIWKNICSCLSHYKMRIILFVNRVQNKADMVNLLIHSQKLMLRQM